MVYSRRLFQKHRRMAARDAYGTEAVWDAIEIARWSRGKHLRGLRCHSEVGTEFRSVRYGDRSVGSVRDSFDGALAETVNGYCEAELVGGAKRP
jgi:putative transposase